MKPNDAFQGITTLVATIADAGAFQGTGFFYQQFAPADVQHPEWKKVEKLWLVSNRHVIFPRVADQELVPSSVTFHLRKVQDDSLLWDPIAVPRDSLLERARVHPEASIDVCIVDVLGLVLDKLKSGGQFVQWLGVSTDSLPGKNNIFVEAGDDVIVIGYPRSFYDQTNLYPVLKAGIIASKWDAYFNGMPHFLIDAKLFPGSSGSIVVSKPRDIVVVDGQPLFSKEKQFAFLGIYSGEPVMHQTPIELDDLIITQKSGFNLGIVWYGRLVQDIIENGVPYPEVPPKA
jgi:hypothetical protein